MAGNAVHPLVRLTWQLERLRGRVHLPLPRWLCGLLFHSRLLLEGFCSGVAQVLIYEPGLRYRCRRVGAGLRLDRPGPRVMGNGVIDIGDDVTIGGGSFLLVGLGLPEPPRLCIGDHVRLGLRNIVSAVRGVSIGNHVHTGPGVCIYDNDMHPLDPELRRARLGDPAAVKGAPIVIEDHVRIGANALILKGVTLGRSAVVLAGAVVTEDVPPGGIAAGNPAQLVGRRPDADTAAGG
ncbi:MAG: acyltransferase [Deltaproteobacteria bacterium]|nr:acyltransferase [Deltaproteobacteria bacterium]